MVENETIWQQGEGRGGYRAFLLRCWPQGSPARRFTPVVKNGASTQKGFTSLEDVLDYLRQELEMNGGPK